MYSTRRLIQLSTVIQENTAVVDDYIQDQGLPEPSFDASYPPHFQMSSEVENARKLALEALDELREHLLGPVQSLLSSLHDLADLVGLHGVTHFELASKFPLDSTISITELAKAANMHPEDTSRIVQAASTRRIFKMSANGTVSHTASSSALVKIPSIVDTCKSGLWGQWSSAPYTVLAMEKWPGSQELNETAYNLAHRTELPFFEHMAQHKDQSKYFSEAMKFLAQAPQLRVDHVLEYDWGQHTNGKVVDVGGSTGAVAEKILEKHPSIKFVVQDQAEVINLMENSKQGNVTFQAHNFFTPQPVHGADVYLLRWILHDWPDQYCTRILRNLIPALKPKARIVIMDALVPEAGVLTPYQARPIRDYDIVMKLLFNAKERTEFEWKKLISDSDQEGRFEVVDVLQPAGSQLGFVVIQWTGGAH